MASEQSTFAACVGMSVQIYTVNNVSITRKILNDPIDLFCSHTNGFGYWMALPSSGSVVLIAGLEYYLFHNRINCFVL